MRKRIPQNQEHLEAQQKEADEEVVEVYKNCSQKERDQIDAIELAVEILKEEDVKFALFPFSDLLSWRYTNLYIGNYDELETREEYRENLTKLYGLLDKYVKDTSGGKLRVGEASND